jgi:phenylpropionate dioxygenase-like ring-hydroxylating dioxygenase large terminal subunit
VDPTERHTGHDWLQGENYGLWREAWVPVAGAVEVEPGEVLVTQLGPFPVLVIRSPEGDLRAFHNVCPHRGHPVCSTSGPRRELQCTYHRWTFGLDGGLLRRPDAESFSTEGQGLSPLRVDELAGLIWLNADPTGVELADWLGPVRSLLCAQGLDRMSLTSHVSVELACNWKLSAEVHLESYHVHTLHPEVLPWVGDTEITLETLGIHGAMRVPLAQPSGRLAESSGLLDQRLSEHGVDSEGLSLHEKRLAFAQAELASLRGRGIDTHTLEATQLIENRFIGLFPNTQLNSYGHSVMLFRHHPHPTDPGQCRFEQQIFSLEEGPPSRRSTHRVVAASDPAVGPITEADLAVAQRLQSGAHSPAFAPQFSDQELLLRHFYSVLDDYVERRIVSSQSTEPGPSS